MYIREGQIWQGFVEPSGELKCVTVLEAKTNSEEACTIIGFTDEKEIYFMQQRIFENKFEYKA